MGDDWQTTSLGEILEGGQLGGNYKNGSLESDWPLVKMGNLGRGRITLNTLEFVDRHSPPSDRDRLRHGDVLFNTRNTLDLVGKVAVWRGELQEAYFNSNIMRLTFQPNRVEDAVLMGHVLNTPQSVSRLRALATGTTSVAAIYTRDLLGMEVLLPPRGQQRRIREALEDADALIECLEQLLAKKRQLKQGAMQELLTGKKRLPGFARPWGTCRLGDLLRVCHGRSQHNVESADGPFPILATGGQIGWASEALYAKPSVLIGRKGTIDKPQYMDRPFWSVDTLFYTAIAPPNEAKYLFYRFCLIDWTQYNEASGVPSLNARTIESIEFKCPEPDEQSAIATVLSTLDTELEALEARLAKARAVKQGMAQALLTGRIRLAPFGEQASAAPPG